MSDPVVLVEKFPEGYAVVTLNRPAALNALSRDLRNLLAEEIDRLEADPDVRVLVITGAGRAFTAGLDLKELGSGEAGSSAFATPVKDPVAAMGRFSGPIIGAINGVAITGGFELALACDVLIASTEARFADTHARVGVIPGWGLSQRLSRAVGVYRAKELSLTGNFLSAKQACDWGMVNRVVEPADLMPQAVALARDMLSVIPSMLTGYKRLIDDGWAVGFGEAMGIEKQRSQQANVSVAAGDIAKRRLEVTARGHERGTG